MTLMDDAKDVLVGGVNSPVRAFNAIGGDPIFMKRGEGPYLFSESNDRYIDYVGAFGPHLFGHAHPEILNAVKETSSKGLSFGTPTVLESQLAREILGYYPSMEKIRFVNSGTEATMSALRLARGITKRSLIVKFDGGYHGHADSLLVSAGSGSLTLGQPDSAGVPPEFVQHTISLPYNDVHSLESFFTKYGDTIAGVILEGISGNMGVVPASKPFIETLSRVCKSSGALIIFDEVMTGFRVGIHGAQGFHGVSPDITCLGKVIGGGLPCGAYGASSEYMSHISPLGPVYQAGTMSGNPVVMSAGLAMMSLIKRHPVFEHINHLVSHLSDSLTTFFNEKSIDACIQSCGSMFTIFLTQGPINQLTDVNACDLKLFSSFYRHLLDEGIYFSPSQFEAQFVSYTHQEKDIEATIKAVKSFWN